MKTKKRRYTSVKTTKKIKNPIIKILDNKDGSIMFERLNSITLDKAINIMKQIVDVYDEKNVEDKYITDEELVKTILRRIGENPDREGLIDTPKRVVKMWGELFKGYDINKCPLVTTFNNGNDGIVYDEMITDTGTFFSHCEHHMVPFFGKYYFGYIPHPKGKLLGLSKVARVVNYYSSRLQIQERLVHQIIEHLWTMLSTDGPAPIAMAVVIEGEHLCKTMRGVKIKGKMRTSELRGTIKTDALSRSEFMDWVNSNEK